MLKLPIYFFLSGFFVLNLYHTKISTMEIDYIETPSTVVKRFDLQIKKFERLGDTYNVVISKLSRSIFIETCDWDLLAWKKFRGSIPNYYNKSLEMNGRLFKVWKLKQIQQFKLNN